jgi:hypothetical protein
MAFESRLPAGCVVITESNWRDYAQPVAADEGQGERTSESGYVRRDYGEDPVGSGYGARPFPSELLIPENEWKERIEERERKGLRLIDRLEASGVFKLDQSPSWYCWCYATIHGVMAANIAQNEPPRMLTPESVAGPIMNYHKKGGWCSKALAYIAKNGVSDVTAWPWESHAQANKKQYFEGSRDNASKTIVNEWWDGLNREEKASCLLRDIPVPDCYDYEGHATCSMELIYKDGAFGVIDVDSYFKRNGNRFHARARMGRKAWGTDAIGIRSVSPNSLPATN